MGYFPTVQRGGAGGLSRPIIKVHNIDTDENKTKEVNCLPLHLHSLSFVLYPSTSEPSVHVNNFLELADSLKYRWMAGERSLSHELIK